MYMTTNTYNQSSELDTIYSFFSSIQRLCGLSIHVRVEDFGCVTLVDLEQVARCLHGEGEGLSNQMLSAAEQDYFKRFSYPKRRREWLGGRIAVKIAMLSQSGQSGRLPETMRLAMGRITILPDASGRPVPEAKDELLTSCAISISHSSRFVVGFATRTESCGVDLQKISEKLSGLIDRFATSRELDLLAGKQINGEQATGLTMLWTTKEALKKSLLHDQPAIFSGIEAQEVTMIREKEYRFDCAVKGHPEQRVMVYNFSPYILSFTMTNHA